MKRKGFTLIEVIAVIIIIGILALVTVPAVARYITSTRNKNYLAYEENLVVAAQNKVTTCVSENDISCNLPDKDEITVFYMNELVSEGYIDEFKDPESDGFCKTAESYVEVTNSGSADFSYKVCLKCSNYATEGEGCSGKTDTTEDNDKPVCGEIVGESTRWTNQDRVITVGCSDATTGCINNEFSKKFTVSVQNDSITIRDKSGNYTDCPVRVYVDKEKPTCTLERVGGKEEAAGWYSGEVKVKLTSTTDTGGSGLLTYGIGTTINNRDYNKKTEIKLNQGLTTVIGYVKDYAGNEGVCTLDVRVGAPQPQFDIEYGYQIFPNKETYTLQGMSISGTTLTTTTADPGILFTGLSKHGQVSKVVIHLNTAISRDNDVAQVFYSTSGSYSEANSTRVVMDRGSKMIEVPIPSGTYSNIRVDLGDASGVSYNISKIELRMNSGDRTSFYTNKDVSVNLIPKNEVVRTVEYSFDNGSTYQTSPIKVYGANFTNIVKTKNIATLISEPKNISVSNIDKSNPTVAITATKKSSASTVVASDTWSNDYLNFKFIQSGVGISGATIYYCKDTDNTCNPTTAIANNTSLTLYNTIEGVFYIRYKIVSGAGTESSISSYKAKTDLTAPTITSVTGNPTSWVNSAFDLVVNGASDSGSGLHSTAYSFDGGSTWQASNSKSFNLNQNVVIKVRDAVGNIYTHSTIAITRVDVSPPTCTISKSNTGTVDGVNVTITCNDTGGSNCSSTNVTSDTGLKSDKIFTVTDVAGNSGTCTASITKQVQKRTSSCTTCKRCSSATCAERETCEACGCDSWGSWKTQGGTFCYNGHKSPSISSATGDTAYSCALIDDNPCYDQNLYECATIKRTCNAYKSCSSCNCKTRNRDCGSCGCDSWGSYDSWTNATSCSEGESSNHKERYLCRTLYS